MLTRDNVLWTLLALGGAAGYVASHFDRFPFIPEQYQGVVELLSFLCGFIGAKAGMSPLPKSDSDDQAISLKKVIGL